MKPEQVDIKMVQLAPGLNNEKGFAFSYKTSILNTGILQMLNKKSEIYFVDEWEYCDFKLWKKKTFYKSIIESNISVTIVSIRIILGEKSCLFR